MEQLQLRCACNLTIVEPDERTADVNLTTGASVVGHLPVMSSINQGRVFAFCCSRSFEESRFAEFSCDACVVIARPDEFLARCAAHVRQRLTAARVDLTYGPVTYRRVSELERLSGQGSATHSVFKGRALSVAEGISSRIPSTRRVQADANRRYLHPGFHEPDCASRDVTAPDPGGLSSKDCVCRYGGARHGHQRAAV